MEKVKKGLRLLILTILILLALCGVPIIFTNKERYMDKEINTEQIEKDEDEEDENQSKAKN